ncbi:MAG: gcvT [Acidimicrobiia bacterium]|nr:gcvT [Acidimicrobiia bacterium]
MRLSPLDAAHRAMNAKMVEFGGWEMPLSYEAGTLAEHLSCRSDAVAFDVSHLGTVRVEGRDAHDALQWALTNDLDKIKPGRAQYTHLCAEDGSVLDDIIVWWRSKDLFDVMPNASNTERVVDAIGGHDVTAERAVIAVQGPHARRRVATVSPEAAEVGRFRTAEVSWKGIPLTVAGTGYTGEDGIEISVPADEATPLWEALMAAGIAPAGLGARDTLRLEAGLPLHGHELGPGITPLQAGLGWVVAWHKSQFRGKPALVAERKKGPQRVLRGLVTEGRQPPRAECPVWVNGAVVGTTTSGNFSPVLECGIALAFLSPKVPFGEALEIEVRDSRLVGQVSKPPFISLPSRPDEA